MPTEAEMRKATQKLSDGFLEQALRDDPAPSVRIVAARGLRRADSPTDALMEQLKKDPNWRVKFFIAKSLLEIHLKRAKNPLRRN